MKRPKIKFTRSEVRSIAMMIPSFIFIATLAYNLLMPKLGWIKRSDTPIDSVAVVAIEEESEAEPDAIILHHFDPNTATYEEFRSLGLSASVAASVVKYRERGKRFEIPEDFATCYGVTDSIYAALKPYIVIGDEFKLQPFESNNRQRSSTTTSSRSREYTTPAERATLYLAEHPTIDINSLTAEDFVEMGCTVRQADAVVSWRDERRGFRSIEEVEECRYLPLEIFEVIAPVLIFGEADSEEVSVELIELNSADSATLVAVRGIGARTASDIIAYRERLGGFARVEQLAELAVMNERNYEQIITQIFVDSCKISKIDINFARPESMESHPYMTPRRLRKILKNRQLKGGWSTIEDMINDHTLTIEEAERLSPYLHFSPIE